MVMMQETNSGFLFMERLSPAVRVSLFVFGFFPLLAPYQLLIQLGWSNDPGLDFGFFAILSLGAVLVSLFLFATALFGRDQQLEFDRVQRKVRFQYRTAVSALRTQQFPFHMVKSLAIHPVEGGGQADTYSLQLTLEKRPLPITFGRFEAEEEAQTQLLAIQKMLYLS